MDQISDEAYEELKQILEKQYGQAFTIKDVKEIGKRTNRVLCFT